MLKRNLKSVCEECSEQYTIDYYSMLKAIKSWPKCSTNPGVYWKELVAFNMQFRINVWKRWGKLFSKPSRISEQLRWSYVCHDQHFRMFFIENRECMCTKCCLCKNFTQMIAFGDVISHRICARFPQAMNFFWCGNISCLKQVYKHKLRMWVLWNTICSTWYGKKQPNVNVWYVLHMK